ncbi:hypothetical protein [Tissierella sp. P1]|uniref:hypothetical protein n=1 Tax=Tissierella sp. P1 TaxID=1280483 RepID=UPI0019148D04|nr:hypothetical protein [Tissierella sp. P1]
MKAYNEYMNKILVSETLHQRLVSSPDNVRLKSRPIMIKRYVAAFACLTVILLGVLTIPQLMQNNVIPMPGETPSVSQPSENALRPTRQANTLYISIKPIFKSRPTLLFRGILSKS